jgi:hypothetical protein
MPAEKTKQLLELWLKPKKKKIIDSHASIYSSIRLALEESEPC